MAARWFIRRAPAWQQPGKELSRPRMASNVWTRSRRVATKDRLSHEQTRSLSERVDPLRAQRAAHSFGISVPATRNAETFQLSFGAAWRQTSVGVSVWRGGYSGVLRRPADHVWTLHSASGLLTFRANGVCLFLSSRGPGVLAGGKSPRIRSGCLR